MRTSTLSVSSLALLALGSCNAVQPKPACKTQATEYVAKYFKVSGDDTCAVSGEVFHLMHYPADRTKPTDVPKIAIESTEVFDAVDRRWEIDKEAMMSKDTALNKYGTEYALGKFTSLTADDNDICSAPTLAESSVDVPEIPGDMMAMPPVEGHPAVKLGYKWSNFKMLTKANSNAVHWGADLERTVDGCTAKYNVSGIWPVRPCGNGKDPMTGDPDPHSGAPDDGLCKATDRHHDIHDEERELNDELAYECDKDLLLCVPAKKFPSRK